LVQGKGKPETVLLIVGSSDERVYLECGHPAFVGGGIRVTVFWTPLSELLDDVASQLEVGPPPWKPWRVKKK
jgi:hypothetical protein